MKILIVDDNLIQRMMLVFILQKNNHQVVEATGGAEALQLLESQPDVGLMISDIMMPGMDGLELLRRIKANARLNDLPVIICTALRDAEHVQQLAALGCRYYILKPVQAEVVVQKVQEAVESRQYILRDAERTRQKLGMDRDAFLALVVAFEKIVNEEIILIEQKVKDSGMDSIRLNLATLYENAMLLGAERLSNILADLLAGADLSMIAREDYLTMLQELKMLSERLAKMTAQLPSSGRTTAG